MLLKPNAPQVHYHSSYTSEEVAANDLRRGKLVDFIKSGEAILMVGAGSSGSLFPDWGTFVQQLQDAAQRVDPSFSEDKNDFLVFADKVKECLGDRKYYDIIYSTFQPASKTHERFHEVLCSLPFRGITTTNYDIVLESALTFTTRETDNSVSFEGTNLKKIHQFLLSLNYNTGMRKRIAHLHGIYDNPESIVLGGGEYRSKYGFTTGTIKDTLYDQIKTGSIRKEEFDELLIRYGYEWPIRRKLLWSLLATRRLVFIGFSMSDPYFLKMLDFVRDDLSTYKTESHFLVLRTTVDSYERDKSKSEWLNEEYGVQTVFYWDENGKYSGLGDFIMELEGEVMQPNIDPTISSPILKTGAMLDGDASITDKLFKLSRSSS